MHLRWQRIAGTIALTASLSTIMLRGVLRDDDHLILVALLSVPLIAAFSYRLWPSLVWLWEGKLPFAITWQRILALIGVGILIMFVIVRGASWFGYAFDPWLVWAYLTLAMLMGWIGDRHDGTIRLRQPRA